ncbi:cold-regulated 1 [Chlorella sorokiniana]|uniref:Cold-regulated 1 n=1 Tax=Chlorella sorokiniana TaxID=3076 RepID=A0A2P6TYF3_CHLSO|nr:cold-regulated 1 [Chlorella sorokiniana]|eukprot:PRW59088.1 cold-regulated 1 [Chlorella sorokiniana]
MEKIKEMVTGKSKEERHVERAEREAGHAPTGAYANVGATYGAEGASGIAAPVAPAPGTAATGYREGEAGYSETRMGTAEVPVVQQVEDRPVVKERVEQVETRQTGAERAVGGGEVEHLGTKERIVSTTPPTAPCE